MGVQKSRLCIVLLAATPLSFRSTRDPQKSGTIDHIPGPTLWGALAQAHDLLRPDRKDQFDLLFGPEGVSVSAGYPWPQNAKVEHGTPQPAPITAVTCKRVRGFAPPAGEGHYVADRLFAIAAFCLAGRARSDLLGRLETCPTCGQALDAFSSFCVKEREGGWVQTGIYRGSTTRVGIFDPTGTAEAGILYSLETISEGTSFWVEFRGEPEHLSIVLETVKEATDAGVLRVGTNRTRGLGRLELVTAGNVESISDLDGEWSDHLTISDQAFRTYCARHAVDAPHEFYFSLTLKSDAVVVHGSLRFAQRLDPELVPGLGNRRVEMLAHAAAGCRLHAWSSYWRLPRADELGIRKGSAFLYGCGEKPDAEMLKTLRTLSVEGLGRRRRQGLGSLSVSDPFHTELGGSP
jgi:CRISPR-associated protein Csx10